MDIEHFEKFLSAYPGYKRETCRCFLPPGTMERVNAALKRQLPTKEEWEKEFKSIKPVNLPENRPVMFGHG